ncbi:MAG TPA: SGNH/GDSL hydrolase family protein [Chloroflexia bacterium]|nr:SGNH/GDSL hydrolase family protein [Chloroflexia bacterium]
MWRHYVALGDSLTEGVGDYVDGIDRLGWVDQFYEMLRTHNPGLLYTNLGQRDLMAHEVRYSQLEVALAIKPDLVSVIAGANDIFKRQWHPERYEHMMADMFEQLLASGATVITATMPDLRYLPVAPGTREKLLPKIMQLNEVVRRLAFRYDLALAETWYHPITLEKANWSKDGLHLNAFGYTGLARNVYEALEAKTRNVLPLAG